MPTELLISALPTAIRIAYCEAGSLQALLIAQPDQPSLVEAIYRGRVCRLLPALQAAFVDIGLSQPAFLPARHVQALPPLQRAQQSKQKVPLINQYLYEGQSLPVQVTSDPQHTKGPQLTTRLSLSGRYLVLLPQQRSIQLSRHINSVQEGERLTALVKTYAQGALGWMIRTAAMGATAATIAHEMTLLQQQWQTVLQIDRSGQGIRPLYQAPPRVQSILRDYAHAESVQVDCPRLAADLMAFSHYWMPEICHKIKCYQGAVPLFQHAKIEAAIQQALGPSVALPSGGDLLIEQTSALTTIDVNSGRFVSAQDTASLALQTNLEAAQVIAQQLRLRHLGGIIVVDFIDMQVAAHRQRVLTVLQQALDNDRVKTSLGGFSPLGLVEMVRPRTRDSAFQRLYQKCPCCQRRGELPQ